MKKNKAHEKGKSRIYEECHNSFGNCILTQNKANYNSVLMQFEPMNPKSESHVVRE